CRRVRGGSSAPPAMPRPERAVVGVARDEPAALAPVTLRTAPTRTAPAALAGRGLSGRPVALPCVLPQPRRRVPVPGRFASDGCSVARDPAQGGAGVALGPLLADVLLDRVGQELDQATTAGAVE